MPHTMLSNNALIWLLMLTIVLHSCLGRSMAGDSLTPNLNSSLVYRNSSLAGDSGTMGGEENALTTLQHLGDIAIKIVTQVQGQEVDLNSITKMLTELAKASVIVNNPKMMPTIELEEEVNSLKQDVNRRIQEMEEENEQMKETVSQLVQNSTLVSERLMADRNKSGISHAFQAFANENQMLTNKAIIKFSNVDIDESDSYNEDFGFYICPDDGDYFISAAITPYHTDTKDRMVSAHVKQGMNGIGRVLFHMVAIAIKNDNYDYFWLTGSGSYITHCQRGENIWVEGAENSMYPQLQGGRNEFGTMFHIFQMN